MVFFQHIAALAVMLQLVMVAVHARREFVGLVPNGNNVGAVHALGHIAWDGGGPLNRFGVAFAAAGYKWTKALCEGDADGDGQTNGQELGDPCCTWVYGTGRPPLITDVLSHPGDYGSVLNDTDLERGVQICGDAMSSSGSSLGDGSANDSSGHVKNDENTSVVHVPVPALPQPISAGSSVVAPLAGTVALCAVIVAVAV